MDCKDTVECEKSNTIRKMSVAQIRKALSVLRQQWSAHSPATPICLTNTLEDDISISDFCFNFVVNHHTKRMSQKKVA